MSKFWFSQSSTLLYIKCGAGREGAAAGAGRNVVAVTESNWTAVSTSAATTSTISTPVGAVGLLGPFPTISC